MQDFTLSYSAETDAFTVTDSTGTVKTYTSAPVVAPTDTEVDILLSDGTTKKFVPAA